MQTAETLLGCIYGIEDILSVFAKGAACICQAHLLAIALEELYPERLLERLDLEGDRRLAHIERASCLSIIKQVRQR